MSSGIQRVKSFVRESRFLNESYFLILSVVLAFGLLQTLGAGLGTERPVVTVISTSMCPALQVGDILVVQDHPFEKINEDDIIVYDVPDRAEFRVNGEKFSLELSEVGDTSVETDIGTVELVDVRPSGEDRSRDSAVFRINGRIPQSNGKDAALIEGNSYNFNGGRVDVDYLTSLPRSNVPIVHRVIDKNDGYLQTIGDNNDRQLEFEDRISPDQIHGKVAFEIPWIGLFKIYMMDLTGYTGEPFVLDSTPSCR